MDATVFILVILSGLLHPVREVLLKHNAYPEGLAFAVMMLFGIFSGLQVLASGQEPWAAIQVWPAVLVSGTGLILFYLFTIMTLKLGDVSVYYPITRSSPLFVVAAGYLVLGQRYSPALLSGIALVIVSVFFLQYRRGTRMLDNPRALSLAALAMCANGIIILADAEAMKTVSPSQYFLGLYLLAVPVMALVFAVTRPSGRGVVEHLFAGWRSTPWRYLAAGMTAYGSYYLILTAFQLGGNVAAVAALRQISIPVAVLFGSMHLGEERMASRLGCSILLAAGVVMILLSR